MIHEFTQYLLSASSSNSSCHLLRCKSIQFTNPTRFAISSMKASVKLLKPPFLIKNPRLKTAVRGNHITELQNRSKICVTGWSQSIFCRIHASVSSPNSQNSNANYLLSVHSSLPSINQTHFSPPLQSTQSGGVFQWHLASGQGPGSEALGGTERSITVVLLGWLGAKPKHLKRYVEWYNSRGINAVTFVVEVTELLCLDLGVWLEQRIAELGDELCSWVCGQGEDGRERRLLFHTFSNTGWFTYGLILDRFRYREGFRENIRGVIVDSGGGDPWDPKVWAAGFSAAIMKKRSSTIQSFTAEQNATNMQKAETSLTEFMLSSTFEKLFSFIISRPAFDRRLRRIVNALSEHQPACPQLYLYSSADAVIPAKSIEMLVELMRSKGMKVFSFDFRSSPHVDHYRNFPDKYSSQLHNFLQECFAIVKQT